MAIAVGVYKAEGVEAVIILIGPAGRPVRSLGPLGEWCRLRMGRKEALDGRRVGLAVCRIDILGSLAGIAVFSLISFLQLPPIAWGAVAAVVMLVLSFALMFGINALQNWTVTRHGERR